MPIQRLASRAQTWQSSGYVCRTCRHALQKSSVRGFVRHSSLSTSTANDAGDLSFEVDTFDLLNSKTVPQSSVPALVSDSNRNAPRNDQELGGDGANGMEGNVSAETLPAKAAKLGIRYHGGTDASGEMTRQMDRRKRLATVQKYISSAQSSNTPGASSAQSKAHTKFDDLVQSLAHQVDDKMQKIIDKIRSGSQDGLSEDLFTFETSGVKSQSRTHSRKKPRSSTVASPTKKASERRRKRSVAQIVRKVQSTRSEASKTFPEALADGRSISQALSEGKKSTVATDDTTGTGSRTPKSARPRSRKKVSSAGQGKEGDSPASGAGDGGDDGEHKSLWQVMAAADALVKNAPTPANEPIEIPESSEQVSEAELSSSGPTEVYSLKPSMLRISPLNIPQPPVPGLEYGLDRVLFNPGVYQLQDPLSRVFNFDPYLQKIMPVEEFDFNALKEYKTSSQDGILSTLAQQHNKRYIGSTSSMTGTLAHFHYLLSDWRPINVSVVSRGFVDKADNFTQLNRAPNAVFLRWKDGTYAIDADKEYDSGNVLMLLGKSMERLLTMPTSDYERYRKSDPRTVSEEERTAPEAYEYTTMGDFVMRSQLDAYDPRLPGTGMFDLKTRAVLSVRMDAEDFKPMTGYELYALQGKFGSYEREYYDMLRSTMLKYMLQARMGRMDGIFVAYHNVERIFGFQYIPIQDMDRALHGQHDPCLGDQEFKTSLELLNKVFDKATAKFPEQSLRFHFETSSEALGSGNPTTVMWIFAEPMPDEEIDRIQATSKERVAHFERVMMGVEEKSVDDSKSAAAQSESALVQNTAEPTSSLPPSSPESMTSHSDADSAFIDSIAAASSSSELKPLFAASLICKSRINGVSHPRPEQLKRDDEWEVEYLLREWDAPSLMWGRYTAMKARRKEMFEKLRNEDVDPNASAASEGETSGNAESSKQRKDRHFIDFLRSMSDTGRQYRVKMDELDAAKERIVYEWPGSSATSAASSAAPPVASTVGVDGVDDYMAWLYCGDKS